LVRDKALRPVPETYEYVFLNAKVLQKAYNRGYASYSPTGRECSRKGKSIVWKKAWLPLYSQGAKLLHVREWGSPSLSGQEPEGGRI
jgi:hypothetical protein